MIVGSHVDSVPAGGWLDGALGLFAALEVLRQHADGDRPVGLRFVDWADEEGARFGRSLFGSSACAGTLEVDEVRDLKDREGERLEDVVARHDVDLAKVHESGAQLKGARAYLELHIEQGPVLEARDEPAAVVLGTVGVERRAAVFSGRAAHAGATPMDMRQDSFLAAARAALLIQQVGLAHEGGYCTTGGASSDPGVVTAVAGRTELLLDQRHLDAGELAAMLKEADEACHKAAEEFGCTVEMKHLWSIPPIPFDDRLIGFAKEALGTRHRDPVRPAARRGRDGAADPDRDGVLEVLSPGLPHARGGHAGGGPQGRDRGLRQDRGGHARRGGRGGAPADGVRTPLNTRERLPIGVAWLLTQRPRCATASSPAPTSTASSAPPS